MAEPEATRGQQPATGEAGEAVSSTPATAAAEGGSGQGIPPAVDPSEPDRAGLVAAVEWSGPVLVGEQVLYRMGGGPSAGFYRPAIVVRCIGEATADLVVFTGGDPGNSDLPSREPVQLVRTVTAGEEAGQFIRQTYRQQIG